ncbi:aspartate aminotransferase family protein [Kitasatospora paracochleata]|uniref:Glutamate/tyrosine decarboxylase-like PLP-dependent enzyme n=1 Tax=Kitasatospora paracochleata TaxID=58354 RepID=A0ABT1J439_9ACTN|nr:pyridoxal-dependent decarboxylase [Kitasatospora paracochleata]MCP2311908.1 glutamate/tyrosine decarboxylase-like PLP-dependent enzyme [Kitasatospora paracochleata]
MTDASRTDTTSSTGDHRTDDFRTAARATAELVSDYLAELPGRPVWQPMDPAERQSLLELELPEHGADLAELLKVIAERVMPAPMGNGNPRFFGWVNSAPQPAGVLATLAASAMNPSSAGGDHADVHLERAVVRWIAELVGFPHPAGAGLLTSGTSMATIVCLAAARGRAARRIGWDVREQGLSGLPPLVGYVTGETHSCVRKAAELLGLGSRHLRTVATDADGHLDLAALRAAIAEDRAAGRLPFLVVASAGTVGTGAVDPFDPIADLCAEEELWLHVDGAYGAFGALDPVIAHLYAGMDRADSLALDPHKWLGVPVDCGCALVRDPEELRSTFSLVPSYLRDEAAGALGWFSEYGTEQTRPFRSLKVWASIAHRGRAGVAADIARCTELARTLGELVAADPELELVAPVETSIVAFRYRPAGIDEKRLDTVNKELPVAVQLRGRVFVTGALHRGREMLRACLLNAATTEADLRLLLEEVRSAGAELTARRGTE